MKKIIINTFFAIFIISMFGSCEMFFKQPTDEVSKTTTYPIFVFNGGQLMTWELGTPWVEPGFTCSEVVENGNDLTDDVVVYDDSIDVNVPGVYTMKYTVKNSWGYEKTELRYVSVTSGLDDLTNIAGDYKIDLFGYDDMMSVSEYEEVRGFWNVGNILDATWTVPAMIADKGDNTYIVLRSFFKRKVDLTYVYYEGTGSFDEETNKLQFILHKVDVDGNRLSDDEPSRGWKLQ